MDTLTTLAWPLKYGSVNGTNMQESLEDRIQLINERISIADFSMAIARNLDLNGAAFGLQVTSIVNQIIALARAKEVPVYEPSTGIVYNGYELIELSEKWLISHQSGNKILERFYPSVFQINSHPLKNPSNVSEAEGTRVKDGKNYPSLKVTQHKLSSRRNVLDPAIDKAVEKVGTAKDTAAVYLVLKEMAISGEHPFTGECIKDALCFTNGNNVLAKLSRDALSKRLKKRTENRR